MATVSSGQITIIDLYDAPALNAWIGASQTTTQTYNNTAQTWSPAYPSTPQVLTVNLTKASSMTSLIGAQVPNIKWYRVIGGTKSELTSSTTTDPVYKGGTSHSVLTVKENVPVANNAVKYIAEGAWNDPDTGLPVAFAAEIDLLLVQLGKAAVIGSIYAPNGDFFRNKQPANLTINADLYKDGALSAGSKKIKWFAADASVTTTGHANYDADGGLGWRKITATTGTTGEVANSGFDVAVTTQAVLTVYPNAVTNAQTYKSVITDNAGGTSGTKVTNFITLKDLDDPIMVVIDSTGGTVLKNGAGTSTLRARLFQNGNEIDTAPTYIYTYTWTRWQNNTLDANWAGAGVSTKTGKEISIGPTDVDVKTMFKCEVSK